MLPAKFLDEDGAAVLELIGYGVLLQIPILLFAISLVSTQHDQLAAEAITREALRTYVLFGRSPEATIEQVASSYRIAPSRIRVEVSCRPSNCDDPEGWVALKTSIGSISASGTIRK